MLKNNIKASSMFTKGINYLPQKIQFMNGNVSEYYYDAAGAKYKVRYLTAPFPVQLPLGEVTDFDSESFYSEMDISETYYCGNFIYENGVLSKVLTPEGYLRISSTSAWGWVNGVYKVITTYTPEYNYFLRDHLGNTRAQLIPSGSTMAVVDTKNYYPFGQQHSADPCAEFFGYSNPATNPYLYNGKELDRMHGLNWYDYGARWKDLGWTSVDPLCEKYYWISPYAYCMNNPIKYVDPDGRDGMVTGTGLKSDPFIVTANYYYKNGDLNKDQVEGLNSAVDTYNKSGGKNGVEVKNADGSTSYVKYNLSAQGVDDVKEARAGTAFETTSGETQYYGNIVGTNPSGSGVDFGNADNFEVNFNVGKINEGVAGGMNSYSLNKGVAIHEIGHNLGGEHSDGTSVMDIVNGEERTSQMGGTTTTFYSYPSMSNKFTKIIFNRRDTSRPVPTVVNGVTYLSGEGRLWTRK